MNRIDTGCPKKGDMLEKHVTIFLGYPVFIVLYDDEKRVNIYDLNEQTLSFPIRLEMTSTGTGNMTVLLFSAAMLLRV